MHHMPVEEIEYQFYIYPGFFVLSYLRFHLINFMTRASPELSDSGYTFN